MQTTDDSKVQVAYEETGATVVAIGRKAISSGGLGALRVKTFYITQISIRCFLRYMAENENDHSNDALMRQ